MNKAKAHKNLGERSSTRGYSPWPRRGQIRAGRGKDSLGTQGSRRVRATFILPPAISPGREFHIRDNDLCWREGHSHRVYRCRILAVSFYAAATGKFCPEKWIEETKIIYFSKRPQNRVC